jgi:hypothetical protein
MRLAPVIPGLLASVAWSVAALVSGRVVQAADLPKSKPKMKSVIMELAN